MMHTKLFAAFALIFSLISVSGLSPAARVVAQHSTQDIVFGATRNYTHKSGQFSIAIPSNWNVTDASAEDEVIVTIIDPTENGVVVVRVYQPNRGYTQAELGEMLKGFLSDRMGSFDGFIMGELKSQRDGSVGFSFKYNSVVAEKQYKMLGDAFIEQHNGLIGLLTLIMPQDQYDAKRKSAYEMVNSFRVTAVAR